jgi:DNA-binding MarR family transcriptional regulator
MASGRPLELLGLVVERKKMSLGEIARDLGVSRQRAWELALRLVTAGMATKEADPLNGKTIYLRPTKEGRARIRHPEEYGDV